MFTVEIVTTGTDLSPLQLRAAFRQICGSAGPTGDKLLPTDHIMKLWVFMLINRLKFLASEQRTLMTEELIASITGLTVDIEKHVASTPMVVIADSRYATWYNRKGWLDLTDGSTVEKPEKAPLETIAFNLAVLFHRNKAACEELTRRKVTKDANSTG